MFPMSTETMNMIAIAVALIAIFYLYREIQKTKADVKILVDTPLPSPPVTAPPKKKMPPPPPPPPSGPDADDAN